MLRIHGPHTTNTSTIQELNYPTPLTSMLLKSKLQFFGHIVRKKDCLEKTIMLGRTEGRRTRGRPRTRWIEVVKAVFDVPLHRLLRMAEDRGEWRRTINRVARGQPLPDGTR